MGITHKRGGPDESRSSGARPGVLHISAQGPVVPLDVHGGRQRAPGQAVRRSRRMAWSRDSAAVSAFARTAAKADAQSEAGNQLACAASSACWAAVIRWTLTSAQSPMSAIGSVRERPRSVRVYSTRDGTSRRSHGSPDRRVPFGVVIRSALQPHQPLPRMADHPQRQRQPDDHQPGGRLRPPFAACRSAERAMAVELWLRGADHRLRFNRLCGMRNSGQPHGTVSSFPTAV
jgi:hypothetical protein